VVLFVDGMRVVAVRETQRSGTRDKGEVVRKKDGEWIWRILISLIFFLWIGLNRYFACGGWEILRFFPSLLHRDGNDD